MNSDDIDRLGIGDNSHLRHGAPSRFIPTDGHGNEISEARSRETRSLLRKAAELHPLDLCARLDWLYVQNGPAASDARWLLRNGAPRRTQ